MVHDNRSQRDLGRQPIGDIPVLQIFARNQDDSLRTHRGAFSIGASISKRKRVLQGPGSGFGFPSERFAEFVGSLAGKSVPNRPETRKNLDFAKKAGIRVRMNAHAVDMIQIRPRSIGSTLN